MFLARIKHICEGAYKFTSLILYKSKYKGIPLSIWAVWIVLSVFLVGSIYQENESHTWLTGGTLVLSIVPVALRITQKVHIPDPALSFTALFLFGSLFLGQTHNWYEKFWWWDTIFHGTSAVAFTLIGVIVLFLLFGERTMRPKPIALAVLAFSIGFSIGGVWEIFEFAMDVNSGTNLQSDGINDTMWDLITNFFGGLIGALLAYLFARGKSLFFCSKVHNLVHETIEKNRRK